MSQTVQTQTVQHKIITISDLRKKYRDGLALAKRLKIEPQYKAQFGSEKKFLSQFKVMPYDTEAGQ